MGKTSMFLMLTALSGLLLVSCGNKSESLVEAYVIVHNRHEVQKVLTYFTEDAYYSIPGGMFTRGKTDIRKIEEFDSVTHNELEIKKMWSVGDTIVIRVKERSDFYRLAGIDEIEKNMRFDLQNSLIAGIEIARTEESYRETQEVFQKFIGWASANRKTKLDSLLPGGNFTYGVKGAKEWLKLLEEWRIAEKKAAADSSQSG